MSKITDTSDLHQPDAPHDNPTGASQTQQDPASTKLSDELIGDTRRIYLQIPDEMEDYVARHGAQYDVSRNRWYVIGEVPEALESFGPSCLPRQRLFELIPICPLCRAPMMMRYSRRSGGDPFWGCSRFPQCKGTVDWEPSLPKTIGDTLNIRNEGPEPPRRNPASAHELLKARWEVLVAMLYERIGPDAGEIWLFRPHPDLSGKTPAHTMLTWAGAKKVEQLIKRF